MKWLIASWGEPSNWKPVKYYYKGKSIISANHLSLIQEVEKPDKTLILINDSLAYPSVISRRGNNIPYEEVKNKLFDYIVFFLENFNIKSADIKILPAGEGIYNRKDPQEIVEIKGNSKDVKFIILWYLIRTLENEIDRIFKEKQLEVLFDVSHGLNFIPVEIYHSLLLFLGILSFFGIDITFKMLTTEPWVDEKIPLNIIELENTKVSPLLYPFKTKDGYKSALKPTKVDKGSQVGRLIGELGKFINFQYKEENIKVNEIALVIGAFYNGLPLAVWKFYKPPSKIKPLIEKILEVYFKGFKISSDNNKTTIQRSLYFSPYTEVLFITYLYNLLSERKSAKFLNKQLITLKELREFSCIIFQKDDKKLLTIEKEIGTCKGNSWGAINEIIKEALKRKINLRNWISLKELKELIKGSNNNQQEKEIRGIDHYKPERNFLAHAGLSQNEIEVKYSEEKELYIRYRHDRLEEIKAWIQKGLIEIV